MTVYLQSVRIGRSCAKVGVSAGLLALIALCSGCGGTRSSVTGAGLDDLTERAAEGGVELVATVAGDWDDVDAALMVGLERAEVTTLTTTSTDDKRTWELYAITGQGGRADGLLTITRDVNAGRDSRGCEMITIAARLEGPRGREQATRLVRGVRDRLSQLAGVAWAPVR